MKALITISLLFSFSCKPQNELDLFFKTEEYVNNNFEEYSHIYKEANNWLENMKNRKLEAAKDIIFSPTYEVDKLIVLNESRTKLVGTVNISHVHIKNCIHDWIFMYWGVKIDGEWYFMRGGNLFVPREMYVYDINKALSYEQLSVVGRDFFLKKFFNTKGELTIKNDYLNSHVNLSGKKYENEDGSINWKKFIKELESQKIDSQEFEKIKYQFETEVHQDAIIPEKGTKAFRELYGTKPPLFERDEWKKILKK